MHTAMQPCTILQDAALQQHPTAVALPGDAHRIRSATVASPAVRALAREHGLDLSAIAGTGPSGRILKGDVLAALPGAGTTGARATRATTTGGASQLAAGAVVGHPPHAPLVSGQHAGDPRKSVVPLRGYRRAMVAAMEASNAVPHFHLCDEVDLTQLVAVRQRLRGDALLNGQRLTFLPFVIKVARGWLCKHACEWLWCVANVPPVGCLTTAVHTKQRLYTTAIGAVRGAQAVARGQQQPWGGRGIVGAAYLARHWGCYRYAERSCRAHHQGTCGFGVVCTRHVYHCCAGRAAQVAGGSCKRAGAAAGGRRCQQAATRNAGGGYDDRVQHWCVDPKEHASFMVWIQMCVHQARLAGRMQRRG